MEEKIGMIQLTEAAVGIMKLGKYAIQVDSEKPVSKETESLVLQCNTLLLFICEELKKGIMEMETGVRKINELYSGD